MGGLRSCRVSTPVPSPGFANDGIPRSTAAPPDPDPPDPDPADPDPAGADPASPPAPEPAGPGGVARGIAGCSMNATCRQVDAPSAPVLSYDIPSRSKPSSGTSFHCLQATSQALQPMQIDVSVKNPLRGGCSP